MAAQREIDREGLEARIAALPGFEAAREAAARVGADAYLVGGAVRDALLGLERADLDLVVAGDQLALAAALAEGGDLRVHDRFGTATVTVGDATIDVASARAESYPRPGALPDVRPAALDDDLARRDFSVNAIAVPLGRPGRLVDPHDGLRDLGAGRLRVLHDRSLADDPTRALRAARYAARLGLDPEPATLEQLCATDLQTVSTDRVRAELRRLAVEPDPRRAFELLSEWRLIPIAPEVAELIEAIGPVLARRGWAGVATPADAVLAALDPEVLGPVRELAAVVPSSASAAVEAARGRSGSELVLARALGAEWLDRYVADWRKVRLDISGDDLLGAGIAEGEAVGRGLAAALRAKLDGEVGPREQQLRIAIEEARRAP